MRSWASTSTASRKPAASCTPEPASQPVHGRTPTAVTTRSASSQPPPGRASPPGWTDSTGWPSRRSTPAAAYQGTSSPPTASPSAAAAGAAAASSTVTAQPRAAATVASSAPIQPAPTMASRVPGRSAARMASASSMVRSTCCGPGPGSRIGARPGGQHQPVEPELGPVGAEQPVVQADRRLAQPQLQVQRGRVLGHRGGVHLAEHEFLGQRRPVVGRMRLRPDHGDAAGVLPGPQLGRGPQAGQASRPR